MPNSYEKRLIRVLEYIHANPAGDLSLDALADVAAMSRFHWHRVFPVEIITAPPRRLAAMAHTGRADGGDALQGAVCGTEGGL